MVVVMVVAVGVVVVVVVVAAAAAAVVVVAVVAAGLVVVTSGNSGNGGSVSVIVTVPVLVVRSVIIVVSTYCYSDSYFSKGYPAEGTVSKKGSVMLGSNRRSKPCTSAQDSSQMNSFHQRWRSCQSLLCSPKEWRYSAGKCFSDPQQYLRTHHYLKHCGFAPIQTKVMLYQKACSIAPHHTWMYQKSKLEMARLRDHVSLPDTHKQFRTLFTTI